MLHSIVMFSLLSHTLILSCISTTISVYSITSSIVSISRPVLSVWFMVSILSRRAFIASFFSFCVNMRVRFFISASDTSNMYLSSHHSKSETAEAKTVVQLSFNHGRVRRVPCLMFHFSPINVPVLS